MTDELLAQANNLKNRIADVENLLAQLDLKDPSGVDTADRISPIMLQAGMAQTIQFEVVNPTNEPPTQIQLLDDRVHSYIVAILKDYKQKLEEMFTNLA